MPLCPECRLSVDSRILCQKCYPDFISQAKRVENLGAGAVNNSSVTPGADRFTTLSVPAIDRGYPYCSPGVSLALGFIPGVGAICNGDYWKGFLQVLIFGGLLSLAGAAGTEDVSPVLRLMAVLMYIYMPLEAYHIAKKQSMALRGVTLITPFEKLRFSSLTVGIATFVIGIIFLVNQFVPETMSFVLRGWPLALIAIGIYNLTRYFRLV
jgi:hypothetical protein